MSDHIDEMIKNSPRWVFKEIEQEKAGRFSRKVGLSAFVSKILILRGIETENDLYHFLNDDIYELNNPFLFTQMDKSVQRVKRALYDNEKIFIFGDRDVDGVLSTAMLHNMLNLFDAKILYKVPEGEYGYGIEFKDIDFAKEKGVKLIITVDTGISSCPEIEYTKSLGIDTIVIDHHVQPPQIPEAYSILNPKMQNETYPYTFLSAGGVVLKFIHAFILSHTKNFNRTFVPLFAEGETVKGAKIRNGIIEEVFEFEESIHYPIDNSHTVVLDSKKKLPRYITSWLKEHRIDQLSLLCETPYNTIEEFARLFARLYLRKQRKSIEFVRSFIDLAAISTVSDIMPLTGENRIIVKEGLKRIRKTTNLGLDVLLGYCNLPERALTAKDIAWNLSPIINSAGRMGNAQVAVDLFTTDDVQKANFFSKTLIELNEKRKEKGEKNFRIIKPIVEDKYYNDRIIVLSTDKAEHGVTGILASKIARIFAKPAIIIVNDGKLGIGSGRGRGNFDLVGLMTRCEDLLVKYGGHKSAIGFTIDILNIEPFRKRVNEIIRDEMDEFGYEETLEIDEEIEPDVIDFDLLQELSIFEPTGVGNAGPLFFLGQVMAIDPNPIGKDKNHLKFYIPKNDGLLTVIGWGLAEKGLRILQKGLPVDIVFSLEDNFYRGERTLQLVLHDLRSSSHIPVYI
jgi:single-stranded-DNA-specific exonuclease